jgi:hypothetical protein
MHSVPSMAAAAAIQHRMTHAYLKRPRIHTLKAGFRLVQDSVYKILSVK